MKNMLIKTGHRADEHLSTSGTGTDEDPYIINTVSGKGISLNAWGTQKTSSDFSLVHGLFTFSVPCCQWNYYEDGVEVRPFVDATSVNGALNLNSNGGTRFLTSRRHPRYQANRGMLYAASIFLPSPNADGVRDFGMFTLENGLFFRLDAGVLKAVRLASGVEYEETIDIPFDVDLSKGNIYDIQAQWRGVGNIKFFMGNPATGVSELVHTMNLLNSLDDPITADSTMPPSFKAVSGVDDVVIKCGCVDVSSEGGKLDVETYTSAFAEAVSVSTDTPVLVVRQPDTIDSKTNTRDIRLGRVSVTIDKKGSFKVWRTRDSSAIVGATFKTIGNYSLVESDSPDMDPTAVKATSVDTSKLELITGVPVQANVKASVDNPSPDNIEFFLVAGDYLVITASASTGVADCTVEWGEEI